MIVSDNDPCFEGGIVLPTDEILVSALVCQQHGSAPYLAAAICCLAWLLAFGRVAHEYLEASIDTEFLAIRAKVCIRHRDIRHTGQ